MKNKKITRKITQGMYVLTTDGGGCMVDAVSQVSSGDNPFLAIAVMNDNYTQELLSENKTFALSVLSEDVNPEIIEVFGMHSMRDINKFEKVETEIIEKLPIIKDSLGYMICEMEDALTFDTHTLFIGKLIEADIFKEGAPMSYGYYQEHKSDLIKMTTKKGKTAWVCSVCGYVYYSEELPEGFFCPVCKVDSTYFHKK